MSYSLLRYHPLTEVEEPWMHDFPSREDALERGDAVAWAWITDEFPEWRVEESGGADDEQEATNSDSHPLAR